MVTRNLVQRELTHALAWYIQLRWLAVIGILATVFVSSSVVTIVTHPGPLYVLTFLIACYNSAFLYVSKRIDNAPDNPARVNRATLFTNIQIFIDLIALTLLIHYSGGIENPFIFYFIFHIVLASILLSVRAVYIQATVASLALGSTVFLEYSGVIPHIHLYHFTHPELYRQPTYVGGVFFVFISTLFICVALATHITRKLRKRDQELAYLMKTLEATNAQLKKLDRLKTEYVLKVTHELRSPLSTIESCLKVISQGYVSNLDDRKRKEMVHRAERRTEILLDLVNDLLDLSRIKASGAQLPRELMNVCPMIEHLVDRLKAKTEAKGVQVTVRFPCRQPAPNDKSCFSTPCETGVILSNRNNMDHLFLNLIGNAVKYSTRGSTVDIFIKDHGDNLEIGIRDTGIGIPQSDLPKIFNEFQRGTNAKAHDFKGTGLGLAIVREIIRIQGGEIGIESEEGKGTTVNVLLPKK